MTAPAQHQQHQWYYSRDNQPAGPVAEAALCDLIARGDLRPNDLVWREGMPQWLPAGQAGLVRAPAGPPPFPPQGFAAGPSQLGYATPIGAVPGSPEAAPEKSWLLPTGRSGWAIAAGYLGLFSLILFPAPVAVIVSLIALRDIRRHPGLGGMGRAVFGLILGLLGTAALMMLFVPRMFR